MGHTFHTKPSNATNIVQSALKGIIHIPLEPSWDYW